MMAEVSKHQLIKVTFGSWYGFLAMGLGSGLSPKAPGTAGSLAALIVMIAIDVLPAPVQWAWLAIACWLGVWVCQRVSRDLGVHDHGAIVWDEFVGMWCVLVVVPMSLATWGLAFLLFRLFDVIKPWPIGWLDRRLHGGLGIMADDLLAAVFALMALWLIHPFFPIWTS